MSLYRIIFNAVLFVFSAFLCCAALKKYFKNSKNNHSLNDFSMPDKMRFLIIAIAVICGLFMRLYKFGSVPCGVNQDEAMAAVDANALANYGTDRFGMKFPVHLTAWEYGQMSSLLSYLMAFAIKLFGFSTVTIRLPLLIISLVGLIFFTLLVKDVFGKDCATIAFAFAAINPWHIMQSRWSLDCDLLAHFFIIGAYFLNRGVSGQKYNLVISMIMFGLCMYCYGISIYTVTVFLFVICIYLLATKKIKFRYAAMSFAVYAAVAWPFITCMAINYFKLDTIETPLFTIPYFSETTRAGDILIFSKGIIKQFVTNCLYTLKVFPFQLRDKPWNEIRGFGSIYMFSAPFALLGLFDLIKNHRKNTGGIIIFALFCTGIFSGIMTNRVHIGRINFIFYPVLILCALGIKFVLSEIDFSKWSIPVIYAVAFAFFAYNYFAVYPSYISQYFYEDFGQAVESIKDTDAQKIYITADSKDEGAVAVSEIWTQFYHQTDALYYQGIKKDEKGMTFSERYVFESIKDVEINPDEDAVYVVRETDLKYFPSSYSFTKYGRFYVVESKQ